MKVGIVGASGYVGQELLRILLDHPKVQVTKITSRQLAGQKIAALYRNFMGRTELCFSEKIEKEDLKDLDFVFLALPHGVASHWVTEDVLSQVKVIDIGADFRIKDQATYEAWYQTKHGSQDLLKEAVYGLTEWNQEAIQGAKLLSNPGCYPTASAMAANPLLKEGLIQGETIILDAKSGVSGAGRGASQGVHYAEVNENFKAYGVATHRHTPEIEQTLSHAAGESITLNFTPHLLPMSRGILVTMYASLKEGVTKTQVDQAFQTAYKNKPFVRIMPEGALPETKWVKGSNFCDLAWRVDQRTNRVIVVSCIDNLIKGAAGQAIQNMNLMAGWSEELGLLSVGQFPG
jgi:N-acetyl-gamma-glutamyl-phosphate reductase